MAPMPQRRAAGRWTRARRTITVTNETPAAAHSVVTIAAVEISSIGVIR